MAKKSRFQDLPLGARPPRTPLHRWLFEELRRAILEGRLKPGARLPSTRNLARQQSIARATVVSVFEQLQAEGYLASQQGSGTIVARELPDRFVRSSAPVRPRERAKPARGPLSPHARALVVHPPPTRSEVRPFDLYHPGIDCFPVETWTQLAARRLRLSGRALLAPGDPRGYRPLREAVAQYLGSTRSVRCDPGQVVIVSGTQQALDFVARLTIKAGDPVWLEEPGFPGAAQAFENVGAKLIRVPVDPAGLSVGAAAGREPAPKLIYVTPAHQFPLGMTMSLERRLALLAFAERERCWIFEDDYDGEYRYDVRPIGALQGHDRGGGVIYAGSFNKLMFPALRLGYLVLPPALVEPLLALRDAVDRYPPVLEQAVLADFIREGQFERHIRRSRALYLERRDALLDASRRHLAGLLDVQTTAAGFHVLGWLPDDVPDTAVQTRVAELGLEVTPLSSFYHGKPAKNGLLLGFATANERALRSAVERLATLLREWLGARSRSHRLR